MIVLDQHDRPFALGFLDDGVGELAVDGLVHSQSAARKIGRVKAMWQSGHSPSLAKP